MHFHITAQSSNQKTGKIPVTTSTAKTCPTSCPFNHRNAGGCYAEQGKLALHWKKVSEGERGQDFRAFLQSLASTLAKLPARSLWRHNQAGDLPGLGDRINRKQSLAIASVNARHNARGYTYTHKPVIDSPHAAGNRETVQKMNARGFTVNLSGNTLAHADRLADLEIAPVVCVIDSKTPGRKLETPAGRPVVICPAQLSDSMTCAQCGLCAVSNPRRPIVGFLAHGTAVKKADSIAKA